MAHVVGLKRAGGGGTEHADCTHIVLISLLLVVSISVRPVLWARHNFPLCMHVRMTGTRELAAGPELTKAHLTEAPPTTQNWQYWLQPPNVPADSPYMSH